MAGNFWTLPSITPDEKVFIKDDLMLKSLTNYDLFSINIYFR